MKLHRTAFTLIELMISISILSLMMVFLYKSYASLNMSNTLIKKDVIKIIDNQKLKKTFYIDVLLSSPSSIKIDNRSKNEDFISMQSSNSIHKRFNPYIAYIVKNKSLYRLESLKNIDNYQLPSDSEFDVDYLGEVDSFRVYKSSITKKESYLVHVDFSKMEDILFKVNALN